ncbi:MAG: Rpn family recombination-promoting nuclease/putative transposase, partial [Bacteroides sp.]|nr:Rpn family recombination-promoting nuclease/putative transposase [Bacteroides sp.]
FNKTEDELTTDLDKWLYMLKNLSDLLERPAALRDKIFKRIFDAAEISSLDDEDKKKYISNMQTARDTYNQLEYAKKKGREEGLEKGLKQGRREIAVNLLRINLPVQTICEATGLSAEEITKLQSEA